MAIMHISTTTIPHTITSVLLGIAPPFSVPTVLHPPPSENNPFTVTAQAMLACCELVARSYGANLRWLRTHLLRCGEPRIPLLPMPDRPNWTGAICPTRRGISWPPTKRILSRSLCQTLRRRVSTLTSYSSMTLTVTSSNLPFSLLSVAFSIFRL